MWGRGCIRKSPLCDAGAKFKWHASVDGAVNKRNLSTGETRESAREILAPQDEPGGG